MYINKIITSYINSFRKSHRQNACRLVCVIAILLFFVQGFNEKLRAQVIVDSKLGQSEILIGEQTTLTTTVTANKTQHVIFPNYIKGDTIVTGVEVLSAGEIDTLKLPGDKRIQLSRSYTITSFDSALYSIPCMAVEVDGHAYRGKSRAGLKVNTVEVDTIHVDNFAMPFDVLEAPYSWTNDLLISALGLWLLMGIVFFTAVKLSKRKPQRKKVVIPPPIPPHKVASEHMNLLRKELSKEMDLEENKNFFIRLTDIVRHFIADRYSINATERTSNELVADLKDIIDRVALEKLQEILFTADNAKFAKYLSSVQQRKRLFTQAEDLMLDMRDELMEQPQPTIMYVTYSDVQQHRLRMLYWTGLTLSIMSVFALFTWILLEMSRTYF